MKKKKWQELKKHHDCCWINFFKALEASPEVKKKYIEYKEAREKDHTVNYAWEQYLQAKEKCGEFLKESGL